MVKALKGVLVQCDESIMAIIIDIDNKNGNSFIVEILDDETCFVQVSKVNELKIQLNKRLERAIDKKDDKDKGSGSGTDYSDLSD